MTPIVCTVIVPLLLAAVVRLRLDHLDPSRGTRGTADRGSRLAATLPARAEALSAEIAARGARGRRRVSDATLRHRHLAAVLPRDARG